jgi:DNA-binding beta-propeller fold protein YncE
MADDGISQAKRARRGGLDARVSTTSLANLGDAMWLAVDPLDGETLFVCTHYAIITVSPTGVIALLAGGKQGFSDGHGREARFNIPRGIAVDQDGNLLVADCNNHAIRKVRRNGTVTTLCGNGQPGFADGLGKAARFSHPFGIALDPRGQLFVADFNNNAVRQVSPSGAVVTAAGNGVNGWADGEGACARFNAPYAIACDKNGLLYISDAHNNAVRKMKQGEYPLRQASVTTLAGGCGPAGFGDGIGTRAVFNRPAGIALDGKNRLYPNLNRKHAPTQPLN